MRIYAVGVEMAHFKPAAAQRKEETRLRHWAIIAGASACRQCQPGAPSDLKSVHRCKLQGMITVFSCHRPQAGSGRSLGSELAL